MTPDVLDPAVGGKEIFSRTLRQTNLLGASHMAFVQWPVARPVLERLAWYVTDRVQHVSKRVPLLHLLARNAFTAFQEAAKVHGPHATESLIALFAGAFRALPALIEVRVVGRDKQTVWDPLQGEPLGTWLRRYDPAKIEISEPREEVQFMTPAAFRAVIAHHVFDPAALVAIGNQLERVVNPDD